MARARRPKHARATTQEGRFLASRMQDAFRRGAHNDEIAEAFGINERTVRRIRSGETSGKRTFERLVAPSQREPAQGANPSIVRVDLRFRDDNGVEQVRTVNARVPTITNRRGERVTPTPADVFRIPGFNTLIEAEADRLARQYGFTTDARGGRVVSFRPIALRRKPLRIEITGRVMA